jgi:hypothetical protein
MVNIIETNISMKDNKLMDHQSRVLVVPSWQEYVSLFTDYDGKANGRDYKTLHNDLMGCVMPNTATINELKYDDFHLTCHFNLFNGMEETKLGFLIHSNV